MLKTPPSSTSALLISMENQGYILHDSFNKTFLPTLKTALLGAWINDSMITDGTILRLMISLQRRTNGTVVLGAKSGLAVQYIHVQRPAGELHRMEIVAGSMRPLLRSAMGLAFLSAMSDEEAYPIIRRLNAEEIDPENRVAIADVMEKLSVCRQEGYSYSEGAATKGAGMVAVLLATPPHQPALGLGVGGQIPFLRSHRTGLVSALRAVVERRRRLMEAEFGSSVKI